MTRPNTPEILAFSRTAYSSIAAVVLVGLIIELALAVTGAADANSGEAGDAVPIVTRLVRLFSFFTIQSNVLVGVVAILLVLRPLRDGRGWRVAVLDALLGIVITGLVFAIVLAPQVHPTGWALVATICLHYISPPLTLAAWLLFGPRPRFAVSTALAAFLWPTAWLLYTFVHGAITHWYPYPFLDAGTLGFVHAITNAVLVVLAAVVVTAALLAVDRCTPTRPR
ncbi:MAG: Pr6Pr family membrane protein [Rhodococcus sp. (in: high G+C Gram-positive bacteria)]|uniref:Pr6Pr family membrane protein n=1 Tax=Rhodococcus sp. TaxID=1831 RepID=UPI003BB7ABF7